MKFLGSFSQLDLEVGRLELAKDVRGPLDSPDAWVASFEVRVPERALAFKSFVNQKRDQYVVVSVSAVSE